jgi:7-cyano-7-deazaguanine synthase
MIPEEQGKRAIVLLSGGMDSSTCLAIASLEGFQCHTLAFDYGQRHELELTMAAFQARAFGAIDHRVVRVDLGAIGGSALTDRIEVPKGEPGLGIPPTYVPARNAIFLSIGLAFAEVVSARDLFIGANQVDYSGYPDCRKDFLEAFGVMANLATRMGSEGRQIRIRAPLLNLNKAEIIARGLELGVDFGHTHTCYDPGSSGRSCGRCPSCRLRLAGFERAGVADPLDYQVGS